MRNVRLRVTLLGVLLVAVTLATAGVLLRVAMERQLTTSGDELSRTRALELAQQVEALPAVLRVGEDGIAQVVASDGRVVSASPNIAGRAGIATFRPGATPVVRTIEAPDDEETERYRVWAVRAGNGSTVYVGRSLESVREALSTLTTSLLVGLPLLTCLMGVALWALVGRMLRRLDETARREREFVGNASHELLGPVASFRTQLEVALAHPGSTEWRELAGDLLDDTLAMERLVKDLLYLARADADELPMRAEPVDLGVLVREVAPGAEVTGSMTVNGDRESLSRLVRNLVENAGRHARSRVLVTLGDGGLVVSDDGPGVAREHRERVFDRFFQADPARTRSTGGAGLGLAIARSVAERHGGSLTLAATGRLGGADFEVRLPADLAK